jgi:bacteriorhodopsin
MGVNRRRACMRSEIKWVLYLVGLGMSLVAYAHFTFATKPEVKEVKNTIERMDNRIYEIWKEVVKP